VILGILPPRFESGNDTLKTANLMLQDVDLMLSAINLDQERVSDLSSSAACGGEPRLEPNIISLASAAFDHVPASSIKASLSFSALDLEAHCKALVYTRN
jgi:hypothetical protein